MICIPKKNERVVAALILAFVLSFGTKAFAFGSDEQGGFNKERWEKKMAEIHKKLGLTPEQEEKLKAGREKHRATFETLRQQIQDKRQELADELQKTDFDMAKVKQIHSELKALKSQKEDARLDGILEVRSILTPEQFKKFGELRKEFKDSHKGKKGKKERGGSRKDGKSDWGGRDDGGY